MKTNLYWWDLFFVQFEPSKNKNPGAFPEKTPFKFFKILNVFLQLEHGVSPFLWLFVKKECEKLDSISEKILVVSRGWSIMVILFLVNSHPTQILKYVQSYYDGRGIFKVTSVVGFLRQYIPWNIAINWVACSRLGCWPPRSHFTSSPNVHTHTRTNFYPPPPNQKINVNRRRFWD